MFFVNVDVDIDVDLDMAEPVSIYIVKKTNSRLFTYILIISVI